MRKGQKHSDATKQKIGKRIFKHGHAQNGKPSPTYLSWRAMILRCYNTGNASYPYYGAVGTTVCERWRTSFEDFLADLGARPRGTSLDRFPNRNGNYEPGNCRWASRLDQARNRDDVKLTLDLATEIMGRLEHNETERSIAARYGISKGIVGCVKRSETWKELSPFQGKHPRSRKLTFDHANEIMGRLEHGEVESSIAVRFSINRSLVGCVKRSEIWKDVPPFQRNFAKISKALRARSQPMKISALVLIMLAALKTVALADPTPTPEDLYAEGQTAYDRADYPNAIAKWRASYELSNAPGLLFNLAQAYRLSGDCVNALSTYKRFITIDPTADQRVLAEDLVRELEPKCGERPTPIVERTTPIPVVDRPSVVHERERPGRRLKATGLATSGTGLALLASGLLLGHHASALGDQVTTACASGCYWDQQKDKDATGRRDATIGYMIDGLGVAAIVGGAVLYYLGDHASGIAVSPRPREGGAVVTWSGSW